MKTNKNLLAMGLLAIAAFLGSATMCQAYETKSGLKTENFQSVTAKGKTNLYVLKNKKGMEVCVTNFGGRIVSVLVPDKNGKMRDVVLAFDNIKDYETLPSDFGGAIGRYANRINHGHLAIDGKTYQLPLNNFGHCLHGGPTGWQYQIYQARQLAPNKLQLTMHSPDGDNNFPGAVTATVTYTVTADNSIDIAYKATTTKKTVINMTNHSYFNLNGNPADLAANNHIMYINADKYTPTDSTFIPTGELAPVKGTPFDFTTPAALKDRVNQTSDTQVRYARGIDHNFVLNTKGDIKKVAASLYSPETGIKLEVFTNEPGIQVYTGNFLDGSQKGKKGIVYNKHASVCMETQHYPDSPNHPEWPSVFLSPGQVYQSHCIFHFSVVK